MAFPYTLAPSISRPLGRELGYGVDNWILEESTDAWLLEDGSGVWLLEE
jgi:hypothetical protein